MVQTTTKNGKIVAKTGNEIMAEAMRQIAPDVVAAYPITPATEIVQIFSQFVADGLVPTEFVAVESEHSAMSACIGSASAGARTMTGTASQGLALMHEMLYIAAGLRLPIIIALVNRALSSPINIHGDHSDSLGSRDAGWIQMYSENSQEAYDNMIQAVKIAEKAKLPAMVTTDGFIISHCMEVVEIIPDEEVKKFLGKYKPDRTLLDYKRPYSIGAIDLQDYFFEHRYQLIDAMNKAKPVVKQVAEEFKKEFNREYGFYEKYRMDDAETAIIVMGSTAGTAKVAVDQLREKGQKVGLIKIRVFRPFPHEDLVSEIANLKAVAVLDRTDSNSGGFSPLYLETTSALYTHLKANRPKVLNYVYGLGGRDIDLSHIKDVYDKLAKIAGGAQIDKIIDYINLRS